MAYWMEFYAIIIINFLFRNIIDIDLINLT